MQNKNIDNDLNKEYKDITFVTMLFNIKDSKEGHVCFNDNGGDRHLNRSYVDYYVRSLEKLCAKFKDIVIFCDKECADNLNAPNAKIIVMKLDELPFYGKIDDFTKLFCDSSEKIVYKKNIHLHKKAYEIVYKDRAIYSNIVLSKQFIMSQAVKYIDTKYLCWLDAGCFADNHIVFWNNWDGKITKLPEHGKVRCWCSGLVNKHQTIKDIKKTTLMDAVYCRRAKSFSTRYLLSLLGREVGAVPQICGMCEIIRTVDCVAFEKKYNEYLKKVISKGRICYEQGVLTLMLAEHPEWFDVVIVYENEFQQIFNGETDII